MWNPHLTLFSKSKVANTREIDMLESYRFMQLPGAILETGLRVGVVHVNITSRRVLQTKLLPAFTHLEFRSLFKQLYILNFVQNFVLDWFEGIKHLIFCQKIFL